MTQSYWDSQFRFSTILPDFAHCLDAMQQQSDAFARGRHFERIPYGDYPRQWVEITPGTGSEPVIPVVIHGGYWRALDAERHRVMMAGLLAQGPHVANIEYRLMPELRLADLVADVAGALAALAQHLPGHRFVLVGHSAGAHLALAAASDPITAPHIRGTIAISGLYELWPVAQSFLQAELHLTQAEIAAHTLDPDGVQSPVLFLTGADKTHEFHRQSARMAQGARTAWQCLPDTHHMTAPLAATAPETAHAAFLNLADLELRT
ncbi:alpha/beta fold hydrolase [uncultured Tateyamaria sp.]|uniref:alpha/beta hydrolase n=1 Tax=uncultured Tateyamaria sp. TaxID=455651 RepID=UPI00262C09E6|nr:alpha/beta fold hydrolase [uncultured Tateyamaria sp.]